MPGWLCFENVKALAGPVATVFAALSATVITAIFASKQVKITRGQLEIAKSQSDIALEKLNYDLFEKRYEIYQATKKVLEHILSNMDFEKQDSEFIRTSFVKMDESRFFFEKYIHSYLSSIEAECHAFFNLYAERGTCNIADQEKWRRLAEELAEQCKKLKEIYGELPAKFGKCACIQEDYNAIRMIGP